MTSVKTWSQGDFTGNGRVDFSDLLLLAQNYSSTAIGDVGSLGSDFASEWALAQSLVPEPTSLAALLGLSMFALERRGRR